MKRKILQFTTLALLLITPTISCKKDVPLSDIVLDKTLLIDVGESAILTVTFIPENATNKKVTWESSDTNIATVDNGKVTGIALGESTITVTSLDGGYIAQCFVYVQPIEPEMVWVEGGTFMMGCTEEQGEDCLNSEKPAHQVTVSGFYIGKYEVIQRQWVAIMGTNPSNPETIGGNKPVNKIKWGEVQEYITKLNAHTGKNYRLPTEAEWEYAARGGNKSEGYKYSGSNNPYDVAYFGNIMIYDVGGKKPNELGTYDMSGNIDELCSDWYSNYTNNPQTNPIGPPTGIHRVLRGGGYGSSLREARVSARMSGDPNMKVFCGFRLALPAEQKKD